MILTPFVFVVFLVWVEWVFSYDLQSESMQLMGEWAPLVGAGLVLIAAVVGRYWPKLSKMLSTVRRRRDTVENHHMNESFWESLKYVWNGTQDRDMGSSSGHVGLVYLQG